LESGLGPTTRSTFSFSVNSFLLSTRGICGTNEERRVAFTSTDRLDGGSRSVQLFALEGGVPYEVRTYEMQ
jgi:hypothetical protein